MIRIKLLGGFGALADDDPLGIPARKTEALLALLALRPGVALGREWLAALLWPDVAEAQARTSLRQAVSHLRRALGEAAVVATADRLHLDPKAVTVDAAEVERLVAGPACERAPVVELYQGELLKGFPALEEPFERWLAEERTRLSDHVATKMEECLAALSASGKLESALGVGTWLLTQEPTRESVHRAMMRLHAERGDRAAALRQLERCRSTLERHLGIQPSRETEELGASIARAEEVHSAPVSVASHTEDGRQRLTIVPFEAISDEGSAPLLALALTEDLRTELARFRQLALVVPDRDEGATGGARLLLRGSVLSLGERTRVTASLVDTATQLQLWAEKWEIGSAEALAVLDRITRSVVAELALKIDETRLEWTRRVPRERLAAYECWLRGMECLRRGSPEADDEARSYFEQAVQLAPDFARAYAGLSLSHFNDWSCQAWDRWELRERLARENAERAAVLDEGDHVPQYILARIFCYRREFAQAERHIENALRLNPNDPDALVHAASVIAMLGDPERARSLIDQVERLNPKWPSWYFATAGTIEFFTRRPDKTIGWLERAPDALVDTRAFLGAASFHRGDGNGAKEHIALFLADFERKITRGRKSTEGEALGWIEHVIPLRRESDAEYLREGLLGAGLSGGG